jgi:hypothetical protein
VLVTVEDQPVDALGPDPIVSAFLAFLERDMLSDPSCLAPAPAGRAEALKTLLEGVVVSDEDHIPDDVTF